jgi:hypothetical protein
MTSGTREELITLLAKLWELSPDVRLGQLVSHLGFLGEAYCGHGLAEIDDDDLRAIMQRHRDELLRRVVDPVIQN